MFGFWLLIVWSPTVDPYILHMRYPTEALCKGDGYELVERNPGDKFSCQPFLYRWGEKP
jgi:hypothetical protein